MQFILKVVSILIVTFGLCAKQSASKDRGVGALVGRVTIGVDSLPISLDVFSTPEIYIEHLGVPWTEVNDENSWSAIDSMGYFRIDSIPAGMILVILESCLPATHPKKIEIIADSIVELNFSLASNVEGGEESFGRDYGKREALQMWNMGLATIRQRSFRLDIPYYLVDSVTGLSQSFIQDYPWMFENGFVDGYNAEIVRFVELFGLPSYSRKPWVSILSNLKEYFEKQAKAGMVDTVWNDGPALFSPDSSYFLLCDGAPIPYRARLYRKELIEDDFFREGFSEIVWGPRGAHFYVAKYFDLVRTGYRNITYIAQDRDDWQPLSKESYEADTTSLSDSDTAFTIGSIEGVVTIGRNRVPVFEARLYVKSAAGFYSSGKKVQWLSEYTDSSGYYRIDSVPVGKVIIECKSFLPLQERKLVLLQDMALRQDFALAPEFTGGLFEYGLELGRKFGKREWMSDTPWDVLGNNKSSSIYLDSAYGLPITDLGKANIGRSRGLERGYSSVIDSLIEAVGLPLNSKKPWLNIIGNLKTYFEAQVTLGQTDTIWQFGEPLVSPDSAICLRFGIYRDIISYRRENVELKTVAPFYPTLEYRVIAWGPENSRFYIEKSPEWKQLLDGEVTYTAFDFDESTILSKESYEAK